MKFDMKDFNKQMNAAIQYSDGFLKGVDQYETYFNAQLAEIIKQAFYKFVDSTARLEPDRLHHVYEWGQTGVDSARLFRIEAFSGRQSIRFVTEFMQSTSTSPSANEPFVDKASVMEAGTTINIAPRSGGVLAFEGDDGDMVFTSSEVTIDDPGGPEVKGAFAAVAREFFSGYLNKGMMKELIKEMETPKEFSQGWNRGMSKGTGMRNAQRYLTIDGGVG